MQSLGAYQASPPGLLFWPAPDRAFVPARVADNPSLDIEDYVGRMRTQLPPVLRQRLLNGDWSVVEDAAIRLDWLRYYDMRGEMLQPMNADGKIIDVVDCRECQRFATVDTAGTSKQKAAERKGKPPSWSVCQIWDYWSKPRFLFLRHVWRDRVAWDGLKSAVRHTLTEWQPKRVLIENAHHGPPLASELASFHTELVSPVPAGARGEEGKPGKLERATQLLNMLEKGAGVPAAVQQPVAARTRKRMAHLDGPGRRNQRPGRRRGLRRQARGRRERRVGRDSVSSSAR